jgi:hypothetical protein
MNQQIKFEIAPYQGAGNIHLGQSRSEVRTALDADYVEFRKAATSVNTADHFERLGIFVYYDVSDEVEAMEFSLPADVRFGGKPLLQMTCKAVVEQILLNDSNLLIEDDGFISTKFGISAYMPESPSSETDPPESILVFREGYYD